jgi:microcystin-dependent protein
MSQPYVGEIRMFAGNFAPAGWEFCQGQTLPISEYETLFNLIGTTYGGDGLETFNLPNMSGRVPVHMGNAQSGTNFQVAETLGSETVTLTNSQTPSHTHTIAVSTSGATSTSPVGAVPAASSADALWGRNTAATQMQVTSPVGGSQPHENLQPYLCINYIISLFGVFPSPT